MIHCPKHSAADPWYAGKVEADADVDEYVPRQSKHEQNQSCNLALYFRTSKYASKLCSCIFSEQNIEQNQSS